VAAASAGLEEEVVEVDSADHPAYKELCELFTRKGRSEACRFLVEGRTFMRMGPRTVFVRRSKWLDDGEAILDAIHGGGEEGPAAFLDTAPKEWGGGMLSDSGAAGEIPGVCVLSDGLYDGLSTQEASQGVICVFALPRQGQTSWATGARAVVLDAVQDSINIGVIMRTMEAFGAKTLIVLKGTVDVYNPKVARASMGAVVRGSLQILSAKNVKELRGLLRGYRIFATALSGDVTTENLSSHLSGKDAFVFGNEARGVSDAVLAASDSHLRIPISKDVDSLNVGVAVGIVLHVAAAAAPP